MAGKRMKIAIGIVLVICAAVAGLFYLFGTVECPYCSTLRGVDPYELEGKRVMGTKYWDEMTEEERDAFTGNPGVYMTDHCPWCERTGRMRRIDIIRGKRPELDAPLP